ncbi:alpha/beta fold hydrolase [Tellurirhabdus bombi]|uniref:alpha/beta fold hydrolase n=1 Tax=Tellurirhabdus bombi TaxID=2907205 RepID=UPI001F186D83|nr:alpha/beta hydrolase [Tellurirhabdus bombi]
MRSFLKALKWAFFTILFLAAGLLFFAHWVELRDSDQEIADDFRNEPIKPVVHRYQTGDRTIRYIESSKPGSDSLPVILFVHGAPSSLSFFEKFFRDSTLLSRARLVAVDRPGYGYSGFGQVVTSIAQQAKMLQPLIERYNNAPFFMLVGSSYGGSLAARLAMNNPGTVDHVVFVSSALGPGLERIYDISYWIEHPPLRWLIPRILLNASDEKLAHREALEEIKPDWHKITAGVTFLHGQKDDLVYPTNVTFAHKRLVNAKVKEFLLPENRHDIVFNKRQYMTDIILNVLASYAPPETQPLPRNKESIIVHN